MWQRTLIEVQQAARDGEGFCLSCGEVADVPEVPGFIPLCENCDRHDIISAKDILRVLELVEDES